MVRWLGIGAIWIFAGIGVPSAAPAGEVEFNRDIRPLLGRHCLACHGRDERHREGGLRLDDRQSSLGEADSGEFAIVPGEPEASEMIRRLEADDSERMPPEDSAPRLGEAEVSLLKQWIREGAPYATHWSFIKPQRPGLPEVSNPDWPHSPVDFFILAQLEAKAILPSSEADRYSLIRRLSLDLRGLPPTLAEVDQFVADGRPDAYERLVDTLLADPAFGERWARPWLDLARYADSSGYGSDPLRTNMWRYRDWVIDALNRNLPFDQFTIEQLAGDLLPDATTEQRLATAFHRNTMTNTEGGTDDEEFRVEAVKDRVDTTFQTWMGLSMGCAKCHDHKYDPISQHEYYEVFAIFNQSQDTDRPDEFPTMEAPRALDRDRLAAHHANVEQLESQLADVQKKVKAQAEQRDVKAPTGRIVRIELPGNNKNLSLAEVQVFVDDENMALQGTARQSSTAYDGPAGKAIDNNTDGHYFNALSTTHTETSTDPWWEVELGDTYGVERVVVWNRTDGNLMVRNAGLRIQLLTAERSLIWESRIEGQPKASHEFRPRTLSPWERQAAEIEAQIAEAKKSRPQIPTIPVMRELGNQQRRETHVLIKGNFLTKGPPVEPGVPSSFHSSPNEVDLDRMGMARWLVDAENPLTARVAVNRIWAILFGRGLVATEEDFGTQGDLPSHPQLLDWLATEFSERGWDVKRLIRILVTSSTYRQSAAVRSELLQRDPGNRWLWRGPRTRLEAELIRDQALAVSGLMSRTLGGPSIYPYQPPGLWRAAFNGQRTWPVSKGEDRFRRGIYVFWRRTVPYPAMATFDAPSRELCTVRRVSTNTPLQAFVTLNDPTYIETSQALARRMRREGGETIGDQIRHGLRLCLLRPPAQDAVEVLVGLYESELTHYSNDVDAATRMATDPLGPLPEGIAPAELAAMTVVANVMLNMDGVLNK